VGACRHHKKKVKEKEEGMVEYSTNYMFFFLFGTFGTAFLNLIFPVGVIFLDSQELVWVEKPHSEGFKW